MSAAKQGNTNGAGNKGHKHSKITRQKMSEVHMGHTVTEETRRKIGDGNRLRVICDKQIG
jgi:hypothetical protein